MARIRPLDYADVGPPMRAEYDAQIAANGRVTNMKRTLAHSPVAFRASWHRSSATTRSSRRACTRRLACRFPKGS